VRAFRFGVDCDVYTNRKALVPHRNAPLTETGRLRLARCVVEDGWPLRRAAERFQVSPSTAQRWADRYRTHGEAGMADRSSRPHHNPEPVVDARPVAVPLRQVHPLRPGLELPGDRVDHLTVIPPSATPIRSPVRE